MTKGIGGKVPKECLLGPFWIKRGALGRHEEKKRFMEIKLRLNTSDEILKQKSAKGS